MRNLFNIKRTKMIDEAAKHHNPRALGKVFLSTFLVFIISNVISNIITTIPLTIYYFFVSMQNGTYAQVEAAILNGKMSQATAILYNMMAVLPWWAVLIQLLSNAVLVGAVIFFWKKFEKRKIASLGIRRGGVALEILFGVGIGLAISCLPLSISLLSGTLSLKFSMFSPALLLFAIGFIVYAAGEEFLIHGMLTTSLARDMKPITSLLISSTIFALLSFSYSLNFMVLINTFLLNFLLGTFVFKRGSLWGAIAIRATWGFLCANIFGMGTMGLSPMMSLFSPIYGNAQIISGNSSLGFESSIITTLVLASAVLLVLLLKTKESEKSAVEVEYFK